MIHVDLQQEPTNFDVSVRQPGNCFLSICPQPKGREWNRHNYWKNCSDDLYISYCGICAYTGQWFSKATSVASVDHFYPKCIYPEKAYEWDNYRLTTSVMNSNKGDKLIVDPFTISAGDFILKFPSCLVTPNINSVPALKNKLKFTIQVLKLNEEAQVSQRYEIVTAYASRHISKQFLQQKYPFIALELERQELYDSIQCLFKGLT